MVDWNDGGDVVVSGSDALTKPSGSQFTVSGGNGPYTWSVSGTGATVTQEGYLELSGAACGAFTITVTDCTGRSSSVTGRVTNAGSWVLQTECSGRASSCWGSLGPRTCTCISSNVKEWVYWADCCNVEYSCSGCVYCGHQWWGRDLGGCPRTCGSTSGPDPNCSGGDMPVWGCCPDMIVDGYGLWHWLC